MDENNKKEVCKEYNALKYRTMIMTGSNLENQLVNEKNEDNINDFLLKEMSFNKKQSWNKLTKTEKIKKVNLFIDTCAKEKYNLNQTEISNAKKYIYTLIERKKMTKNNELNYDEKTGEIKDILILSFNSNTRKFALNKTTKKTPTIKKSKTSKTIKTKPKPKDKNDKND